MGSEIVDNKRLQIDKWGNPSEPGVLSLLHDKFDLSKLPTDQVAVKMRYACIHPSDVLLCERNYPWAYNVKNNVLPSTVGNEGIGEVIKVGSNVKDYKVGDRILPASYPNPSQYTLYKFTNRGLKVPADLPDEVGVQLFINPYAAIGLLEVFGLFKGKGKGWLVQNAANSTVGRLVHTLAKQQGVKSIAIVRKPDAVDMMKKLGADKVLVVGSIKTADEYAQKILEATEGEGATYAIDAVGDFAGAGLYKSMSQDGHLQVYGALLGAFFDPKAAGLPNTKNIKTELFYVGDWVQQRPPEYVQSFVDDLLRQYKQGHLDLPVEKVFAFEDYQEAFKYQIYNEKSRTGKVLLKIA